ncbi:MAG: extracellular solute-binding protein [Anaerolineae bacterium]
MAKQSLSRRDFLKATTLMMASAMVAACAPSAPAQAPAAGEGEAPAATEPTPVPTVAVNEYGQAEKPVILWHGLTGADGATFATLLQQYAEENPDQAVRSEAYVWDVFFQKFPTAVAAGTPPDMAIFHAAEVPQMTSQGLMMPLDDVYAAMQIPKDDFLPAVMDVITIEGKTMAVPFDTHGWTCFVNTKVVKDAGLDPENLPQNGEEFIAWAKQITVDESGRHPDEDGFNPDKIKIWAFWYTWPRFTMPTTWFQYGGGPFDPDTNKATLNSENSVAAVRYWHELMYTHHVVAPALPGVPWAGDVYKTDSLAIMWEGTWSLNYFKDNPDVAEHTICVPINSLAPDGTRGQKIDAHIFCIPTGVKQDGVERASKLIKWLSDHGEAWATSGQIPARLSVQKSPVVQEIWSVKASAEAFQKYGRTDYPHKAFIEIQTAWETAVSGALANTMSIEEALNTGNQQIQSILDRV